VFTEPKRMIGGSNTTLEFECGLYVDPQSGDIYSVADDIGDRVAIFSRNAKGNVAPDRILNTPNGGGTGIAVDEKTQELYLAALKGFVLVYKKTAKGNDPPIRRLEGPRTGLADPHGIAVDSKRGLIFVANHGNFLPTSASTGRLESS